MFVYLGKILNSPSSNRSILFGVLAFFVIKLCFISFAYWGMSGPRLGDDAYVYMWGATSTTFNDVNQSPGVSALAEFSSSISAEEINQDDQFAFYRVLLRTTGASSNLVHYIFGYFKPDGWSFYALFWLQESFVLIVMAIGVFTLLRNQTSIYGLGLMLPLSALALFPAQGIHFFIPGTLALSFGLIVWGLAYSERRYPLLLFVAALLAMLSHRIGVVHASIGGWIILYLLASKQLSFYNACRDIAALVLALALFATVTIVLAPSNTAATQLISYGYQHVFANALGAANYTINTIERDPLALLLIVLGMIVAVRLFSRLRPLNILISILAVYAFVMGFHYLDGYPGEAMTRVLIPLFFLLVLLVHTKDREAITSVTDRKLKVDGMFYTLFFVGMLFTSIHYSLGNVEKRWAQIDRPALKEVLSEIGDNNHLLFLEEDIALEASLVVGAYSNKLSAVSLLKASPDKAENWLADNPATYLATLVPRTFTPPRRWEIPLWAHRQPGFNLRNGGTLELTFGSVNQLFVKLDSPAQNYDIAMSGANCELSDTNMQGWYKLPDTCLANPGQEVIISIIGDGSLNGLSTGTPSADLSWPWGESIKYRFNSGSFWGREYDEIISGFDWGSIDPDFDEAFIINDTKSIRPISDASGIIFAQVE